MLKGYSLEYFGPHDLATGHYLNKLVEDMKDDDFTSRLVSVVNKYSNQLEYYENLLKIKVIFEYQSLMGLLNSELVYESLSRLYKELNEKEVNERHVLKKILSFINGNTTIILKQGNHSLIRQTFKVSLKYSGGINTWSEFISSGNFIYLIDFFNDLYKVLKKKKSEAIINTLIDRVLFPISGFRYNDQIDVAIKVRKDFKEKFILFQKELISYFNSAEFQNLRNISQVKMLRDTLGRRLLGIEGEVQLKNKLSDAESVMYEDSKGNGMAYELSSREFAELESQYTDFREKLYLLTFREVFSIYQIMQYQDNNSSSLLDFVSNLEGIAHEKYGNVGFSMRFNHFETLIVLETAYLITQYKEKFWGGLLDLVFEVEELSGGVGDFLKKDLSKIEKLANQNEYFIASTFLVQIIERLLRELYLKLEYGTTDVLREAKYQLGTILKMNEEAVLRRIFNQEEIESMDYFLVNDEYGLNIRNRLAHYNIEASEVGLEYFAKLLHMVIFILIKVDYQGCIFEENLT